MTTQANRQPRTFLEKTAALFEFKDALTEALVRNKLQFEAEAKKSFSPNRFLLKAGLGMLIATGAALEAPATLFFIALKGILLFGGGAIIMEAFSDRMSGSTALRSAALDESELRSYDLRSEADIARLQQQVKFQPQDVQEKFAAAFTASAQKRQDAHVDDVAPVAPPNSPELALKI